MQTYANHRSKQTRNNAEKHTSEHGSNISWVMQVPDIPLSFSWYAPIYWLYCVGWLSLQSPTNRSKKGFEHCCMCSGSVRSKRSSDQSDQSWVFLCACKKTQKQLIQPGHPHWKEETHTPTSRRKKDGKFSLVNLHHLDIVDMARTMCQANHIPKLQIIMEQIYQILSHATAGYVWYMWIKWNLG